jgi:predicted small lipoprotein YifL
MMIALLVAAFLAGPLTACGKKGDPQSPGKDQYPLKYPKAR